MNFLEILNQQPYGIAELTADEGCYLFFNKKEQQIRGLTDSEMNTASVFDLFPPKEADELRSLFNQCSRSPEGEEFLFRYQIEQRSYEMRLSKSSTNTIISSLSEITPLLKLEKQYQQDQETIKCLNDAVNGANIGCWDFYPQEGRIIANKTWVTQKKYRDEDFRENDEIFSEVVDGLDRWCSIVHPDDLEPTFEIIDKHLKGETEVYDAKFRMKCGDGEWRWIHDVGQVFQRDEDGNAIRMNGVHIDITAAHQLEEKVEKLAVTDALTGLLNRRNFKYLFDAVSERAKRQSSLFCLLLIDVDHFKAYNDTYGHVKGDKVLKKISKALTKNIRHGEDYSFRVGGEEFAVIFTEEEKPAAIALAQRIKDEIESLKIPHAENTTSEYVTVSMGLMCANELKEKDQLNRIYKLADELLYKAKAAGRNALICND